MGKRAEQYPNPEFTSIEQEAEYWRTHSPLVEGYEGRERRTYQKRSSYLAVRLSGEELARLREAAIRAGIGPTTLARNLILQGLESQKDLAARIEVLEHKVESLGK
jgi:hypothetical protein